MFGLLFEPVCIWVILHQRQARNFPPDALVPRGMPQVVSQLCCQCGYSYCVDCKKGATFYAQCSIMMEWFRCLNCLLPGHQVKNCSNSRSDWWKGLPQQNLLMLSTVDLYTGSLLMTCREAPNHFTTEVRALLNSRSSASYISIYSSGTLL